MMYTEKELADLKIEFVNIALEIPDLLINKKRDYGTSFEDIYEKVGPISVMVRLMDKVARLNNLLGSNIVPNNESIEDTFQDIMGYCLLTLRLLRNDKK